MLTKTAILKLALKNNSIHLYRRTPLSDYYSRRGSDIYDFSKLKCICGQPIFLDADSISFVIIKVSYNVLNQHNRQGNGMKLN